MADYRGEGCVSSSLKMMSMPNIDVKDGYSSSQVAFKAQFYYFVADQTLHIKSFFKLHFLIHVITVSCSYITIATVPVNEEGLGKNN